MIYAIALLIICDPSLTALFTPARPQLGSYEVCTTSLSIDEAVAEDQHGAIEALEALDAFGTAGPYNRAALARLYGGTRVRVARRWQQHGDQFISETLLSPYPDAALSRLNPGTMVIRFTVDRELREDRQAQSQPLRLLACQAEARVKRAKAGGL